MMDWQFRLFGTPEVWHHQNQIEVFNTQKTQALWLYLIAEGCEHNRNELARFFWDDFNLISSQNNLRTALYHLKQDFKACLAVDRQSVCFRLPESAALDLAVVDAVNQDADRQALAAAAAAYRGEFLEGFNTSIPTFEAWKDQKRAHYGQLIISHLLRLAQLCEEGQQHQQGLDAAQKILEIDPINEAAVLLQMRLCARLGLHEQAVQAFRTYQNRIKEHAEVNPSPLLTDFYDRLKVPTSKQDSTLLPFSKSQFFGREAETRQLTRWLTDPAQRWINLVGPGGVGKSRLAIHAAEAVISHFRDGVRYIDLRGFNAGEEELSIENASKLALYAMQIKLTFGESYKSQLFAALSQREMVFILDNFEPFDWRVKFVTEILQSCPSTKLLGISHQPVDLPGGAVINLAGLTYPKHKDLPPNFDPGYLKWFPSLQLFEDRAQMVQPGFKIDQGNFRQVAHICRLVQGLPLGIEFIANLLRSTSLEDIINGILSAVSPEPAAFLNAHIPANLEKVIDFIWENQEPQAKHIILACALFKGRFSMEGFAAVTQESTDWLPALVEESLLHISIQGKFSLHYLLRIYLNEKLDQIPERYSARYSEHYLNWLIKVDADADSGPYPIESFRANHDNLVHAWELALAQGRYTLLAEACAPLSRAFEQLGMVAAGFTHFEKTAAVLEDLPDRSEQQQLALGSILLECASLAEKCSHLGAASSLTEQAQNIAQALGDVGLLSGALQSYASVNIQTGQTHIAAKFAYDGLTQAVKSGNARLVASGIIGLGRAYCTDHQYQKAMTAYETAIEEKLVSDNSRMKQSLLLGLSVCLKSQGRFNQALAFNQQAQHLNKTFHEKIDEARLSYIRGEIFKFLGQFNTAIKAYSQALTTFSDNDRPEKQALCLGNLGILHYWRGEYDMAMQHLVAAEEITEEKCLQALPEILALKARALLASDQKEQARTCLQKAAADQDQTLPYIVSASIDLALAEGAYDTASNLAISAVPHINNLSFNHFDDPFSVYLSLYHGLKDHGVQSAREVLVQARQSFTRLQANLPPGVTIKTMLAIPHRRELAHIIQNHLNELTRTG